MIPDIAAPKPTIEAIITEEFPVGGRVGAGLTPNVGVGDKDKVIVGVGLLIEVGLNVGEGVWLISFPAAKTVKLRVMVFNTPSLLRLILYFLKYRTTLFISLSNNSKEFCASNFTPWLKSIIIGLSL